MCDAPSYTVNQPSQPSYGEGMADALKAQVDLLKGTGDFADRYAEADLQGYFADIERDVESYLLKWILMF